MFMPMVMEGSGFIDALERMGAKIVAQGLDEVGSDLRAAVGVEVLERSREGRNGKAVGNGQADDLPQGALVGIDFSQEEIVEQEIIQLRILVINSAWMMQPARKMEAMAP